MSKDDEDDAVTGAGGDYLEKEKENDPIEFARNYMKRAEDLLTRASRPSVATVPYVENSIRINRISNGYVIQYQQGIRAKDATLGPAVFGVRRIETFGANFTEVAPVLAKAMLAAEDLDRMVAEAADALGAGPEDNPAGPRG